MVIRGQYVKRIDIQDFPYRACTIMLKMRTIK